MSQQIMRQRIPGNVLQAQRSQAGWDFCQGQREPDFGFGSILHQSDPLDNALDAFASDSFIVREFIVQ
jgi:hypothetical protein